MIKTQYLFFLCLVILGSITGNTGIQRFNEPDFKPEEYKVQSIYIDFNDTIQADTLYEYLDSKSNPAMYSRKVVTGVCIEGECRIVKMEIFWHLTGRYMGFRLEENEFLSKSKHNPFTSSEYDRLHILLSNPNSGLSQYSINELIPDKNKKSNQVDAISSATISAVLDYIVEGAVYTTYTLWHIVYGPSRMEIQKRTSESLNPVLILKLLNSRKNDDVIWCLNHFSPNSELSKEILEKLFEFISGSDVYLAERSLNAMHPVRINSEVQQKLSEIFKSAGFIQQRMIIRKLSDLPVLDNKTVMELSVDLNRLSGAMIKMLLELFQTRKIDNDIITERVSELLANENRFIVGQAVKYLESLPILQKKTQKKIEQVKTNLKL